MCVSSTVPIVRVRAGAYSKLLNQWDFPSGWRVGGAISSPVDQVDLIDGSSKEVCHHGVVERIFKTLRGRRGVFPKLTLSGGGVLTGQSHSPAADNHCCKSEQQKAGGLWNISYSVAVSHVTEHILGDEGA